MDRKLFYLFLVWAFLAIFSLTLGQFSLSLNQIYEALFIQSGNQTYKNIIMNIRIPRILLSSLCGGILALCGISLQGLFKNPLVGPKIIGVSTAAAFGGTLAILFGFGGFFLTLNAFIFGILALFILYFIASFVKNSNIYTLILSGIVVNGFFAALISLVQYVADSDDILPNIVFWLLGSFLTADWEKLFILACISFPALLIIFLIRYNFNLLSLGDDDLKALGINYKFIRRLILVLTTILIAAQVSISGNIGWVGLVVPHMARFLSGSDHIKSIPYSFVFGMIFMLLVDDAARTISANEIPLGILTALIGAPVFVYLLKRNFNANRS